MIPELDPSTILFAASSFLWLMVALYFIVTARWDKGRADNE